MASTSREVEQAAYQLRNTQQQIAPCLFLTSRWGAGDVAQLEKNGITHVVVAGTELPRPSWQGIEDWLQLELTDDVSADLLGQLERAVPFMRGAIDGGGVVLVHCSAGRSRSASVCMGFLMAGPPRLSFEQAFDAVHSVRLTCLNGGFEEQLRTYGNRASPGAGEPPSVPAGFVGRFRHASECTSLDEYARSVAAAIEERSRALLGGGGGDAAGDGGVPAVERVALEGVSPTQFMGRWARQGRPVVLTGCMAGWDTECWSPQGLMQHWRTLPWVVRRGKNYDAMEARETTLGDYLRSLGVADDRSESTPEPEPEPAPEPAPELPFYGANNSIPPRLAAKLRLPPFFPAHTKRALDTRLWIGPVGAGERLHRDLQDNFLLQVFGRKTVTLIPPHHSATLGTVFTTPFLHTTTPQQQGGDGGDLQATTVSLGPGEMLYLPAGYFHRTRMVEGWRPPQPGGGGSDGQPQAQAPARARAQAAKCCDVGCSVNFFLSACFASLGVVVPELCPPDWVGGTPPAMTTERALANDELLQSID